MYIQTSTVVPNPVLTMSQYDKLYCVYRRQALISYSVASKRTCCSEFHISNKKADVDIFHHSMHCYFQKKLNNVIYSETFTPNIVLTINSLYANCISSSALKTDKQSLQCKTDCKQVAGVIGN